MDLSNTILRWLNDFTAQGILTTDAELKICGWNRWLEICSGHTAAQMFGRDLLEAYPELVERRLDSFYQQALAGQVVMLSHRFHRYLLPMPVQTNRAGFQQMQQAARIAPLLEGERVVGTITVIEDVTDRAVREEEFKRQIAVQDALHEIDRAILSLDLDNCLRRVVEKTAALVGAPIAAVVLREGEGLRVGACVGGACDTVLQANTAGSIAAWAAESRQALLLADVAAARDTGALRPLVPGSRSVVAAPLLVENQVIGTLVVESPRPNAFSEAEQELVIALATQAAVAIYNARLYSALRESEARFRSIFENATIGLYRTTPDGRILLANPTLVRMLGYDSFDELARRGLEQEGFEPTYPRSQFKERIERDGEIRSLESTWLRRDGSTVFVRESAKAIRDADGAILYYEGTVEDVTERKRAEEALRESEDRYRDLVEHSHDLICTHDLEGRILSANLAAARHLGYEPDELVGKNVGDILAPEVRAELLTYLETMRKHGAARGWMWVLTRAGERRIWEYDNTLRTEGIATPLVRSMAHDVTERLQAEKRSKAFSELGHRLSAATTPEAAGRIIMAVADRLLGWDTCYLDLYSEATDQFTPALSMDILDGQRMDVPFVHQKRSPSAFERRIIAEGGRLIFQDTSPEEVSGLIPFGNTSQPSASLMFAPIRSGTQVVGVISIQSYTPHAYDEGSLGVFQALADHCGGALERIQAQAAEHEQRLLAEALRDTATALASTLSRDELLDRIMAEVGRVVPYDTANVMFIESFDGAQDKPFDSCSGGIARIVRCRGYVERGLDEAVVLVLRFPVAEVANLRQMIETGQPCIIPDTRSYSAWMDIPETRWVRSYAGVPIRSKGQTIGFLNLNSAAPGFFTETHVERLQAFADQAAVAIENARLYEAVRRHAAELEQRVAERTAELEAANRSLREAAEKLKELNQVKSQFVSNVSHELRTPLTNIKTYLYLLEKGKPEKREQYMGTLHREAELLHQLIEDLLHISRLDLGKAQPALAAVDLNRLVTLLVEDRSIMFSKRGLTLEVRAAPALPPVLADARMLTQVLTNLMTNAMNYTPAGGTVTVRTALQEPPYPIPNTQSQWVTLSVTDTGPGISPEDQAHLFERFYRGEAARQTAAPGTGLGLAICHEIVQRHGGQITVESEVGKGSTFTVWLPAVDDKVTG